MSEISKPALEELLANKEFEVVGKKKAKPRAITISSGGVITWNTPLKGSLYRAGRNVSIRINPKTDQMMLVAGGDNLEGINATVGEISPSCSAIEILRDAQDKHNIKILPNGTKTSSYRYEESNGGLEVVQESDEHLGIIINLSKRKRNAYKGKVTVTASELIDDEKQDLSK